MATTNSLVVEQIEQKEPQLPSGFVAYIESKMGKNGSGGRPHIVKQLNNMDKVLEVLKVAWCERKDIGQISKELKVSYHTVWRFLEEIKEYKNEVIAYIKYNEEIKPKTYESYEIIKQWETMIRRSGHLSALANISVLKNILGYGKVKYVEWKCSPDKFDMAKAQDFIDLYLKEHNAKKLPQGLSLAIRHFLMVAKGIHIPRGFGAQYGLSGEKDSYGKYKFVRLHNGQFQKVREYLKDDLETLTFFDWGVESLAREMTILDTEMNRFNENEGIVTTTLYESKTDKDWAKYLILKIDHCRETWENIQKLGQNRQYLFFDRKPTTTDYMKIEARLSAKLKDAYRFADVKEDYAYRKPFHFLRHTGAHIWLMRTNYDYGVVAELGWEDIDTLRDCYGGMPAEILMSKLKALER